MIAALPIAQSDSAMIAARPIDLLPGRPGISESPVQVAAAGIRINVHALLAYYLVGTVVFFLAAQWLKSAVRKRLKPPVQVLLR